MELRTPYRRKLSIPAEQILRHQEWTYTVEFYDRSNNYVVAVSVLSFCLHKSNVELIFLIVR